MLYNFLVTHVLHWAAQHRWLGILWGSDLCFANHTKACLAAASSHVSVLAVLVASKVLPLSLAALLFESRIESAVRFGRWLWGLDPELRLLLEENYATWARLLLGADPWRNAYVAIGEVGWTLSGSARFVLNAASMRARLWRAGVTTLAGGFFLRSHAFPGSWSSRSLVLLQDWGLPDWPQWVGSCDFACLSLRVKSYVDQCRCKLMTVCSERWLSNVASHRAPIQYPCVPPALCDMLTSGLTWDTLLAFRSVVRFRAGLFVLGHVAGHPSQAKTLHCILCDKRYTSCWYHVFLDCSALELECAALEVSLDRRLCPADMFLGRDKSGFSASVHMCSTIETKATNFWMS